MKNTMRYIAAAVAAVLALCSCSKNEPELVEYLEVTPNNIAGEWSLETWKGSALPEGSYVYLTFTRRERTFTEVSNLNGVGEQTETGVYNIETDPYLGAVIRGMRDGSMGQEWNHRYVVTELTSDRMVWTATDEPSDISVYVRKK